MAASFSAPDCKLVCEKSSFLHEKTRHNKVITNRFFNHKIQITLPGVQEVPSEIQCSLAEEKYFIVHSLPLSKLIDKEFIEAFVKKGKIYMLSRDATIDTGNTVAVLPTGELVLHIDKDTYEELGLEAKPSVFNGKMPKKYVVKIDMTQVYFTPGKKNYERVKWCLSERLDLCMDFLTHWVPHDDEISSTSIGAYFEKYNFKTTSCNLRENKFISHDLSCPIIDSQNLEESCDHCGHVEFWEWLGAVNLGIDCESGSPDDYLTTLVCPSPQSKLPSCCVHSITGFISTECVSDIINKVRKCLESSTSTCPWASVTVHGYHDSPVTWGSWEHGYHNNGDNIYTYVIFPNEDYWLYMALGTNDVMS